MSVLLTLISRMRLAIVGVRDPRYHPPVRPGSRKTWISKGKGVSCVSAALLLLVVAAAAVAGVVVPRRQRAHVPGRRLSSRFGRHRDQGLPLGRDRKVVLVPAQRARRNGLRPYVSWKTVGLPPGLSIDSERADQRNADPDRHWVFWVTMKDIPALVGGRLLVYRRQLDGDDSSRSRSSRGSRSSSGRATLTAGQMNAPYNLQFTATGGEPDVVRSRPARFRRPHAQLEPACSPGRRRQPATSASRSGDGRRSSDTQTYTLMSSSR